MADMTRKVVSSKGGVLQVGCMPLSANTEQMLQRGSACAARITAADGMPKSRLKRVLLPAGTAAEGG